MSKQAKRKRRRVRTQTDKADGEVLGWAESKRRKWLRRTLMQKQQGICALCEDQMSLKVGDPSMATLDHVIPTSRGGLDTVKNLQLACLSCNQAKGSDMPPEV